MPGSQGARPCPLCSPILFSLIPISFLLFAFSSPSFFLGPPNCLSIPRLISSQQGTCPLFHLSPGCLKGVKDARGWAGLCPPATATAASCGSGSSHRGLWDWWRGDAEPQVPSVHAKPAPGAPLCSVSFSGSHGWDPAVCVEEECSRTLLLGSTVL